MSWKKWRGKRGSNGSKAAAWLFALITLLFLACLPAFADKVKDLQEHFDKDSHAGSKVKALEKLGDAQFEAAGKAIQANDYISAGLTFEKYRDNVRAALELLKKQEPDADHHPGSYRQLELTLRKGIREVEQVQIIAPQEMRPPLLLVHKDLIDMDDELIHLLFPRRTKEPDKVPAAPEEKP
jgi:hypothetical protein